ncbi:MAG: tetratricopeptide repeat protein [Planctomycetota bacterium]|nr:MAG: tetratricopeptide repeat protein [Planctomycetota bacterium]
MSPSPSARSALPPCLLVAAVAAAAYLNAFGHEFVYDDLPLVLWNERLRSWQGLLECFASSYWTDGNTGLYRPLTLLSFALDRAVSGEATWSYAATNVLLHACTSSAAFWWARELGARKPAALATALLFAVHPVHTEAVTWVAGRAEVLCGACALVALAAHRRAPQGGGWRLLSGLAFSAALLAKEHAVALVAVAPALDLFCGRGSLRKRLSPRRGGYLLFAALTASYLALRAWVLGDAAWGPRYVVPLDNPLVPRVTSLLGNTYGTTASERLLSAVALWGEHLRLLCWPARLSADYSYAQWLPVRSLGDARLWIGALALGGCAAGALLLRRRAPVAAAGLAFLLGVCAVSSQVLRPTGTVYAERLLYLPSAGFLLWVGCAFDRAWRRCRWRAAASGALVLSLSLGAARTWLRNPAWTNRRTLWEETVRTSPQSARAHGNLGLLYLSAAEGIEARGDLPASRREQVARALTERAAQHLARSLEIYPERAGLNVTYAETALKLGRLAEARQALERARRLGRGVLSPEGARVATLLSAATDRESR